MFNELINRVVETVKHVDDVDDAGMEIAAILKGEGFNAKYMMIDNKVLVRGYGIWQLINNGQGWEIKQEM